MNPTLQVSCVQMHWAKSIEYNLSRALHYVHQAADTGSRVVLFPEATLTSYYFPYITHLKTKDINTALQQLCDAAASENIWVIAGTIRKTTRRYLNIAHVINCEGHIIHEYAKTHLAGVDEKQYCRPGKKLSLFKIDGIWCTLAICRDGRHPEVYRLPAMAGAQILFQPSCSSDDTESVTWKRTAGRAQQPVGPSTRIFHCVANTVGQSPDGKQTTSGASFIREPSGLPLAEAGFYQEEMITAVLDLQKADRSYLLESMKQPTYLKPFWKQMAKEVYERRNDAVR